MQHAAPSAKNLAAWCAEYCALGMADVADRIRTAGGHATMLDVGCGMGNGLRIFDRLGFDVTGIDMSAPEVELARSLGFDVLCESA
ncbi:MAG TPA: methyltransferase domain-containing protein, partial [Polyangiaceae bacterium]|nr:methyltransferase domain-containing protein [Polyangiaceae bacterium]